MNKISEYLQSFQEAIRKPSLLFIIFSACFAFWFLDIWKPYNTAKKGNNFVYDVFGYYSYLPATFCNHGSFDWHNNETNHNPHGPFNNYVPKYTYGMSLMYSPFFALGYKVAYNQKSPLNGFSEPFATCIRWGSIFYVLLGMFFLRKFLLFYFNEVVTTITLVAALFGTMLFIYTYSQSELTHGYLFSLFSVFLYLTYKWHEKQKYLYTFFIGFIIGLISLIRPTDVFIMVFFIFWNVKSAADVKTKTLFFLKSYKHILIIMLMAILLWIPQLFFYKYHTGNYFYFSYLGERFYWTDPQIINILFSYRKGWITYTPMVVLAFIGFFFIKKDFPVSKWTFIIITSIMVYIFSCWWDWGFGGCFGARPFCQQIAFLSIPLAYFIDFVLYSSKKFILKGLLTLCTMVYIFSAICLNLGQSYQYHVMMKIHVWAMTKKVYWDVFRTYQFNDDYQYQYWRDIKEPDFEKYANGSDRNQ